MASYISRTRINLWEGSNKTKPTATELTILMIWRKESWPFGLVMKSCWAMGAWWRIYKVSEKELKIIYMSFRIGWIWVYFIEGTLKSEYFFTASQGWLRLFSSPNWRCGCSNIFQTSCCRTQCTYASFVFGTASFPLVFILIRNRC